MAASVLFIRVIWYHVFPDIMMTHVDYRVHPTQMGEPSMGSEDEVFQYFSLRYG